MFEISVVVPVFNVEKQLCRCVDSILAQSLADFELILVDDGSSDNSGKICDRYADLDSRITVIHQKNKGVSAARNRGIHAAKGNYLCFVDSDDYVESGFLEQLLKAKKENPGFDSVWCGFQTVSGYDGLNKKEIISDGGHAFSRFDIKSVMTLHECWLDASPVNKLFDRRLIKKEGLTFDEEITLGEDLIFNLDYLDKTNGKILVINTPLYNYVQNGAPSLSNRYYPDMLEIYNKINGVMLEYAKKWKLDSVQLAKLYSAVFYKYERVLRNTFSPENTQSRKEKLRFNNALMKKDLFVESLNKMEKRPHPLYTAAYRTGRFKAVLFADRLTKIKHKIFRRG